MKVYISASWKQRDRVRTLAVALRAAGHEVYDFTDPACRGQPEIPPEKFPEQFDPERHIYRDYLLSVSHWGQAVAGNRKALRWCDVCILLLPAGCDSHADWALAVGLGKLSLVVGHPPPGERTPSHLWADALLQHDSEIADLLAGQPTMQCPRCRASYFDFDGCGVPYCHRCGFCRHLSCDGRADGATICNYCGAVEGVR